MGRSVRIISNGKAYDTETAVKITEWHSVFFQGEPKYTESLYKKQNGEYFTLLINNFNTNEQKEVKSLSESEAKKLVQTCVNDQYEKIFGKCEE